MKKKALIITLSVFGVLFLFLLIAPFLFKDKIKAAVDEQISKSINGKVWYDADQFSLTFFSNFPNLSVSVGDFGLVSNVEEFKGDTLFQAAKFKIVVDVMSVISGDQIKIKGVYLKQPKILTMFTKEGKMSWDITYPDTTAAPEAPAEESKFAIGIEKWEIEDGWIIYEDASMPMYAELKHLNHKGSGDITQDIYDIKTLTSSLDVLVSYDGVNYLKKHKVEADVSMNIDMKNSVYKFLDNKFTVNDFSMGFEGQIAMPGDDISMNIKYSAKETGFKNLISLVPAVFMTDYDKLEADGTIAFDGTVGGVYNETSMPGFTFNMQVNNGMMHYPGLPAAIKNVLMDLNVANKDGVIDNTVVNLKKFHMDFGSNPIDARLLLNGLNPYDIDANLLAKINLAEITQMFPVEGTTLKGAFSADVKAKGKYSDSLKLMPVVDAKLGLQDGYVKSKDFPSAMENISFSTSINSPGDMPSTTVIVDYFKILLDGEPFEMKALVKNLDDPNYDVNIKGIIDLTKMTKIYPLEDMTLSGRINADISTKGVMSDIDAGRYDKTSTSGVMEMTNFKYESPDMPQGMMLSTAKMSLTPEKMMIESMVGTLGKSDINVTGYFANYMGYMFGKQDTVIRGNMTFASKKFDVNEWMTEDEVAPGSAPAEEEPLTVFEVPKNIDFILRSSLDQVLYDNYDMRNMTGTITMKDGIVKMSTLKFNMLGGTIITDGTYNTQDIKHPLFDFKLNMTQLSIKESYNTFNTVQAMAPAAKNIEGNFSTIMSIDGELGQDMMPLYNTMSGEGSLNIAQAQVTENKVLAGVAMLTKIEGLNPMQLKDVNIKFKIEKGRLIVQPFDVSAGKTKMNIGGSNGIDGTIDYKIKMDVPAGAAGAAANNAIANLTGTPSSSNQNIKLDLKVTGTHDNPKVGLEGNSMKEQVKDQVKDAVKDKVTNEIKNNADIQKAKDDAEKAKKEAEDKLKQEQERLKQEAEAKKKAEEERLKKEAQQQLKNKLPKLK